MTIPTTSAALRLSKKENHLITRKALEDHFPCITLNEHETVDLNALAKQQIGVLIIDDLTHIMESLDHLHNDQLIPNIIVLYQDGRLDDMIHAIKFGIYDAIKLPSFPEEIQWVVSKAITDFQLTQQLSESKTPARARELFLQYRSTLVSNELPISESLLKQIFAGEADDSLISNIPELCFSEDSKNIRILVVEDEPDLVRSYDFLLRDFGYALTFATSVTEAREHLETKQPFHVVLLDLQLGRSSGEILISEIKNKDPKTEVIIVSAFKDIELILKTIKQGAFDYVVKDGLSDLVHKKVVQALQKQALVNLLEK